VSQRKEPKKSSQDRLKQSLRTRVIIIPIIFAIVIAVICIVLSNPSLDIFPSGNHYDSLTTTAPTQTTEYMQNEYVQS
jgi:hypothetical protein